MPIILRAGKWSSPPVLVAIGAHERWRGLRPRSEGRGLLLHGSSVHAIGMQESLWVAGLSPTGAVADIRLLRPGRVVFLSGAHRVLELPATAMPPPMGAVLVAGRYQAGQKMSRTRRPTAASFEITKSMAVSSLATNA